MTTLPTIASFFPSPPNCGMGIASSWWGAVPVPQPGAEGWEEVVVVQTQLPAAYPWLSCPLAGSWAHAAAGDWEVETP